MSNAQPPRLNPMARQGGMISLAGAILLLFSALMPWATVPSGALWSGSRSSLSMPELYEGGASFVFFLMISLLILQGILLTVRRHMSRVIWSIVRYLFVAVTVIFVIAAMYGATARGRDAGFGIYVAFLSIAIIAAGDIVSAIRGSSQAVPAGNELGQRLKQLDDALQQQHISREEYEAKRKQILDQH